MQQCLKLIFKKDKRNFTNHQLAIKFGFNSSLPGTEQSWQPYKI